MSKVKQIAKRLSYESISVAGLTRYELFHPCTFTVIFKSRRLRQKIKTAAFISYAATLSVRHGNPVYGLVVVVVIV